MLCLASRSRRAPAHLPPPAPVQGFRTAQTRPTLHRIVFRSSMLDPDVHPALVINPPGSRPSE